jgi:hypothetical protein
MCGLLFDVAAEALRTIAADPRHLGAQIGAALVLHTWDSALTRHPHVHGVVPGVNVGCNFPRRSIYPTLTSRRGPLARR